MRIAIIGAGAVGAYFIESFHGVSEIELSVVADGERLARLRQKGLTINSVRYDDASLYKSPEEAGIQDLIIVATKASGIESAAALLPPMTGENTMVIGPFNGVTGEKILADSVGLSHVAYSLIVIASKRNDDGSIDFERGPVRVFIEKDRLSRELVDVLNSTELQWEEHPDIMTRMWTKYATNMANNLPQAIVGADASMYMDSEHGLWLAEKLWEETRKVAACEGVTLDERAAIFPRDTGTPKHMKYSTLQDLEAGRHTEIDLFAGELVKMAAKHGLEVPCTEYVYHLIKTIEEKNDGLFEE